MKNYGIIFCGSSKTTCNVFSIQKIIIKIMLGLGPSCSCKSWFKKLDILRVPSVHIFAWTMFVVRNPDNFQTNTVPSVHIFAWTMFVVRNPDNFQTNASIHSTEARQKKNYVYHL
jgi:hypothetical protein